MRSRHITSSPAIDLRRTLAPLHRGDDDPAMRFTTDGTVWRAVSTPDGPATLALRSDGNHIEARAWGDGADAALAQMPALVGCVDDPSGLHPGDGVVAGAVEQFPGLRLCRTGALFDALLAAVVARGLSHFEAHRAHRLLTVDFGTPAPGPGGLTVPPGPQVLGAVPYFELQVRGVDAAQGDTITRLCARRTMLATLADRPPADVLETLVSLRGIDAGMAASAVLEALGDPDAVPLGDEGLAHLVTGALGDVPSGDDGAMLEALEPWRGQRGRVVRLLQAAAAEPTAAVRPASAHR